jgi:hypothetical protein
MIARLLDVCMLVCMCKGMRKRYEVVLKLLSEGDCCLNLELGCSGEEKVVRNGGRNLFYRSGWCLMA